MCVLWALKYIMCGEVYYVRRSALKCVEVYYVRRSVLKCVTGAEVYYVHWSVLTRIN